MRSNSWRLRSSASGGPADISFRYGTTGDLPVTGDWNGDGVMTPGVVRGNAWYLRNTNSSGVADIRFTYGSPGDVPVVGDWNGDGVITPGVVRGNAWYLRNRNISGVADTSFTYGSPGDVPVVGDWNGDGVRTPGVVRGNVWYLRNSNTSGVADISFTYGSPGDVPVVGDWNGDGVMTPGVVRRNIWYLRNANTSGVADTSFTYGSPGDLARTWTSAATVPGRELARMSEAQRVGQVFMAGGASTGVGSSTDAAVSTYHVGSVILTGRSSSGVPAVRAVTSGLQALATSAATDRVPLLVSADQEGGYVQTLSGPGFSTIPTALSQGQLPTAQLRADAQAWGGQLAAAGVSLDLAPVLDTVPSNLTSINPIGHFQREYGTDPETVATKGAAFLQGMLAAGVGTTGKHFPGLGRVTANTDTTAQVTDSVTTVSDPYLVPFAAALSAGTPAIMVSLAIYTRIDSRQPAAFSPVVVGSLLRTRLGFHGVVVSDDLGNAAAVQAWTPGNRAVLFLSAGGDLVLTVNPALVPAMVGAVLTRAVAVPAFAARVNAAALRVLAAKYEAGLLR